jgi:adhesin HecA-like repeat protein
MATQKVLNTAGTVQSAATLGISAASVNNGAGVLSNVIDLSVAGARDVFAAFELLCTHGTQATAGSPWYLWAVPAIDGTNYERSAAALLSRAPDKVFVVETGTSAQRVAEGKGGDADPPLQLGPLKYKFILWNAAGQNATSVSLTMTTWSPDVQAAA